MSQLPEWIWNAYQFKKKKRKRKFHKWTEIKASDLGIKAQEEDQDWAKQEHHFKNREMRGGWTWRIISGA